MVPYKHDCKCAFCGKMVETDRHVFKERLALQCFWHFYPLKLKPKDHAAHDVRQWVFDMMDDLCSDFCDYFFMALWLIWSERNNLVWKGGSFQPMHMIAWCKQRVEEFQLYHPEATRKKKRPVTKWECPLSGRLKINMDEAFRADCGVGGIGLVVRDESGTSIAAMCHGLNFAMCKADRAALAGKQVSQVSALQGTINQSHTILK
ncbi:uncharacterized protein LOC112194318 [Rosa chinensis]|uniref:uncharacterized protein LOC112194318 n=1 Tax=Rosa chinensis TaxID=74649 RepID=UPI000D08E63F|nr:uncharacterized protein LOC112194318 [Rosa chinensis]